MGWNSWNKFGCNVSETLIRGAADALVATGMKDAGYQYVVIDDCWQVSRDADGSIVVDAERFPSGMKALADYVHSKGLKFGIYSDAGTKTCAGRPGSEGPRGEGRAEYAAWGVDYLKYDWCNSDGPGHAGLVRHDARRARRDRPADRVQHVRVGHEEAVDVGARRRPPLAHDRRHPGLLGLQHELGRHGRRPLIDLSKTSPVRGARRLERSGHARGRQRRHERDRVAARTSACGR